MAQTKSRLISEVIQFIRSVKEENPGFSKELIALATAKKFNLTLSRSVYHCDDFAIRFSTASGQSFSNVVLSLSALSTYDKSPFVICVVRPSDVEFFLANSSFLKKISHSSHQLRVDNVKGSFLGHDIMREFDGLRNIPDNFDKLFAIHGEFTWSENLVRLVEATTAIVPTGVRFTPSTAQVTNVLSAGKLAKRISGSDDYRAIQRTLDRAVADNRDAIMRAAEVNNINQRGNFIEQIITSSGNVHGVEDLSFSLPTGERVLVDVKTKLLNLASSPKGYNIDKFLALLATGNSALSFFFVAIDLGKQSVNTRLVSVLDSTILKATRIQFHWAGRNSRGVTQLTGELGSIFRTDFEESITTAEVEPYLKKLLDL